jgi:hypothetical protein
MAVAKRLRYEVFRRDRHTCRYCGGTAPDVKLTIDHVTPKVLGGSDTDPANLFTACGDCNAGKSSSNPDAPLVGDADQRAIKWSQAMQVAIEQRAAELDAERATAEPFDAAWRRWSAGGEDVPRDANWRGSIVRFLAAGLSDDILRRAVDNAMGQDRIRATGKWKYFCGICWREVDKLHALARKIADGGGAETHTSDGAFRLPQSYVESDLIPEHRVTAALHPYFPSINVAADLVKTLLRHSGVPDAVADRVVVMLWAGEQAAYRAFLEGVAKDPSSDGIGAAWEYLDYAVDARVESLIAELDACLREAWSEAKPDSRLPAGPGLHPGFDSLNLAEGFINDLVRHIGCEEPEIGMLATRGFWAAMEDAYKVFVEQADNACATDNIETCEAFEGASAFYLAKIWDLRGRPDLGKAVADGQE